MRTYTIIILGAALAGLVFHAVNLPVSHKPAAPVPYEYTTFRWPEGTEIAAFNFAPGDLTTNHDGEIWCKCGTLGTILQEARAKTGFDFFAAGGDTVVLRRVAPADPFAPDARLTKLWVHPDPPGSYNGTEYTLEMIGHVKPEK